MLQVTDMGAVRRITLDRPEQRNALNVPLLRALRRAVREAAAPSVRCLVITGTGKAFSAGADLAEWSAAESEGGATASPWTDEMHGLVLEVAEYEKPTVALLNGAAVGAGLDLALACDFRFAADSARFQCAYTRMAYSPDAGGTWLMARLLGLEQAKRFAFTGEFWNSAEALARGLVTEVHPADRLVAATEAFAQKLASGPTVAIAQTKRLLADQGGRSLAEQLAAERRAAEICGASADAKEAMAAAMARREAQFRGQ